MSSGKIYKAAAAILFIVVLFGAVALGNFELFKMMGNGTFSFRVFLYVVIAGFFLSLPLYALGEIINQLDCLNKKMSAVQQLLGTDG